MARKTGSKNKIVEVKDGAIVGFQIDFHPDMMQPKGLLMESALEGVKLRFTKEYVIGKLKHDLKLKYQSEAIELLNEAIAA